MAALSAAFMTRQALACAVKPTLRFPLALPSLSLQSRTFKSTRLTSASVNPDNNNNNNSKPTTPEEDSSVSNLQQPPQQGSLTQNSIFAEDDDDEVWQPPSTSGAAPKNAPGEAVDIKRLPLTKRDRAAMDRMLNPDPAGRGKMERQFVIRAIQRRGRLNKAETVLRTERECVSQSAFFKTSVKKLTKVARQIAGKTVEEALVQMKFSPKKVAKDVVEHLEMARDQATVVHGMGVGKVTGEVAEGSKPVTLVMKNGKKRVVKDPTNIYIAQAWVNRGTFDRLPDHRARGQVNMMKPPHTGLTVLLKEEKTLIREAKDRHEKALRKRKNKVWTQLPDRPISAQNQYYSW